MADNPLIDPGTTPSLPVEGDDIAGQGVAQVVALRYGAKDATTRVSTGSPLPVTDATAEAALAAIVTALGGSGVLATQVTLQAILTKLQASIATTNAAASQVDGHSASIGTTTDAASSTTGTVIAHLRKIRDVLVAGLPALVSGRVPVDGSGVTQPVSGTVTANIGTAGTLALDATLTGGTQQSKITDGTRIANVKAASTAAVAADPALVVAVSPNNVVPVSQPSGTLGAGAQVAVTNVAGTLIAAGARTSLMIRNLSTSAASAFIGPATVTPTTGMEIKPGEFLSFGPGECPTNLIQAITAAGTATLIVQATT